MSCIEYSVHGRCAVIKFANLPVNSLGLALRIAVVDALDRAAADASVAAIVLTGSDDVFSGGADIREFGTPSGTAEPNLATLIEIVEQSTKPVVAAIAGVCMGGGVELALGAHYRVAKADASIALPEVKLGLLPGAGGTQRLPRLVGVELATNIIVSGEARTAASLAHTRLFDELVEGDLTQRAIAFAERIVGSGTALTRVRDLAIDGADHESFFQFARNTVKGIAGPFPAPGKCIDAVQAALSGSFDEGLQVERRLFLELMLTSESRALRHAFFAERASGKLEGVDPRLQQREVRRIGVVGAGTMGTGIAVSFANAGIPVQLVERSAQALQHGIERVRGQYASDLRKGRISAAVLEQRLAAISGSVRFEDLAGCDLVIEAVFEDLALKQNVFRQIDSVAKPGAILATNTSTLDVDRIAQATRRPQDVLGMHFFSPAHVMRLVEVVRGAATAPDALLTAVRLARRIKKTPVVAGVCDGFIGNRMLDKYMQSASALVVDGALPWQIDAALEGWGMAMGPFRMADLAGNDIGWAIRKQRAVASEVRNADIGDWLCERGWFGQKTGAGWFVYPDGSRAGRPRAEVEAMLAEYRRAYGHEARTIDAVEIVQRCIYALVNEGARILDEGIAARASDIDVVYLTGYGFPAHRGGPMLYADEVGLYHVARTMRRFAARGDRFWEPAALIERRLSDGTTLTENFSRRVP
jgi:3-hydroxyacyl-CoA dehydrogenase